MEVAAVYRSVQPRIVGREREIKSLLAALASGRNAILQGPPGTSKSTILREIAREFGAPVHIVEGSADLTPAKLLGTHNPAKVMAGGYTVDAFDPGPLTAAMQTGGFLYIEEFNRVPEDVMNVLLRAIDERRLAIPRVGDVAAKPSFRLVGAMNPFDDVGTERLSRAISDRLCLIEADYQSEAEEVEIVTARTGVPPEGPARLAVRLVRRTRRHPDLNMGSSIRGAIDFVLLARERLAIEGLSLPAGERIDPAIRAVLLECALVALTARVWVSESSERKARDVIREIWEELERSPLPGRPEGGIEPGGAVPEGGATIPGSGPAPDPARRSGAAGASDHAPAGRAEDAPMQGIAAAQRLRLGEPGGPESGEDRFDLPKALRGRASGGECTAERERARRLAERILVSIRPRRGPRRGPRGRFTTAPYRGGSAELDLDRTLETRMAEGQGSVGEFLVRERARERTAYVLILDTSGSMRGEGILRALVAVGAFLKAASRDEHAIVTFGNRASVLQAFRRAPGPSRLFHDLLRVPTDGLTDIAAGLEAALVELRRGRGERKIGVLLTDGAHNRATDPFRAAARFPKLHVVGVDVPWSRARENCERLATLGGGSCLLLEDVADVPWAVHRLVGH